MSSIFDFNKEIDIAWCPGCGNFDILKSVKGALDELKIKRDQLVMVSGIGQAAKTPQYINASFFNGLHGRSLPAATAIKATNPELTVIAESGDGCTYGEGGNHFLATIRRNPDITNLVHDNMVYGLTKGQASPTSRRGFETPVQVAGVYLEPFNPVAVAIAMGATFVARAFSGDSDETREIIKKAINHKGYALVDILHPCVSFNKVNNFRWYKDNTYYLDESWVAADRDKAMHNALDNSRLSLGVIYQGEENSVFEENIFPGKEKFEALYKRKTVKNELKKILDSKKV